MVQCDFATTFIHHIQKHMLRHPEVSEYVQEDDGGSTTSNNQADDVPKIPSSARSIAQLMQDSITQQPPLFLMP
ncbi:unnamed protein product [Acanthoscelides obtectus]|uniref:Uncharacterized protein n=1 Tax=Acanthoscelides obtectus TaxID=200917 RepID=A0A9P0K036_ACAOB|nr:unnamed protein product [Acanthoscelides obtectus]CAK1660354.1 hypothetical protein AOBTE_LOCUS22012 [Acanthoscelides obtectus]